MTINQGKNVDRPLNRELCLLTQLSLYHDRAVQRPHHCRCGHQSSIFPSFVNMTLTYLNSSMWGRTSSLTRRKQSTLLQLKSTGSDLESLIFISSASHSASNCSSESCRPRSDEANRTTSSSKSRSEILRPKNGSPQKLFLHPEVLSIEVMNKIGNKGWPRQSPAPIENDLFAGPAMWTKLWRRSHRDF